MSNSTPALHGAPLAGVAITHLHPGAGRSPGIVDLPVVKDTMGYPLVPASSVKGALKTRCARAKNASFTNDGKINCDSAPLCCCLFGGEVGEGPKGSGAITVLDLVPLAFPVASADKGFVYVAPKSLLARAASIFSAVGSTGYADLFKRLSEAPGDAAGVGLQGTVYLFTTPIQIAPLNLDGASATLEGLARFLGEIHPLASSLSNRLVVLDDSLASKVVDRALLRVTRVRLERDKKTVASGGLWTEEYIPQGTVFASAVIATGYTNKYCGKVQGCGGAQECLEKALSELKLEQGLPVFVGGKETVGKGLIVFKPVREG